MFQFVKNLKICYKLHLIMGVFLAAFLIIFFAGSTTLPPVYWAIAALLMATGLLLGLWLGNALTRRLTQAAATANKMAAGNVTDTKISVDSTDETGRLCEAFNKMVTSFAKTDAEMRDTTMNIAMSLSEHFILLQQVSAGNFSVRANEKTGSDIFDQLGRTTNDMVASLTRLVHAAKLVAAGELNTDIEVRSEQDELAMAFQQMVNNLRVLVLKVKEQSINLVNSSSTLAQVSTQSSQTIAQLSTTTSQISSSTASVAQSSQSASTAAHNADISSSKGKDIILKLVEKIGSIKKTEEISAAAMEALAARSSEIGEIVNVITKIADQTNLLSLNAAIEAARAGEAGRGFAVVADEVRKLAESSANSAQEISRIIKEVQEETKGAVLSVENGQKEIEEGSRLTEQASSQFAEIVDQTENIAKQLEAIAAASEETAASAEESAASSEEQTASVEEIASLANSLSDTARVMKGAIEGFKV